MALRTRAILSALVSHVQASGKSVSVGRSEPRAQPGRGVTAAVWLDRAGPAPRSSGLAASDARVVYTIRFYTAADSKPDTQDLEMAEAFDETLERLHADFQLGQEPNNLVFCIDLLGAYGAPLEGDAGYLNYQDKLYRVMTISVPVIITNAWPQVA